MGCLRIQSALTGWPKKQRDTLDHPPGKFFEIAGAWKGVIARFWKQNRYITRCWFFWKITLISNKVNSDKARKYYIVANLRRCCRNSSPLLYHYSSAAIYCSNQMSAWPPPGKKNSWFFSRFVWVTPGADGGLDPWTPQVAMALTIGVYTAQSTGNFLLFNTVE